ncbi:hypothetical protein SDC9_184179 [bioreactor metagenome]|uniref:Uncharacterized protein n=1 Tax=bioreactor metagenome TaxID=1076179 RepID=A0A645HEV7_9ZZZZ
MIDFSCKLIEHGWIEFILATENDEIKIEPSHLSDAPSDFIIALALLLEGENEAICKWQDEPGEYRLVFTRKEDNFELIILSFKDTFSRRENKDADLIFGGKGTLSKFVHKVLREFNKINIEHSSSGYKELWGYEFPLNEIDRLRAALKN